MMPISVKFTLMILVLPVSSIITVFAVGFYFYRESFDAAAFSTAVSSLLSAILVILLVWERLRDSLSKKLEYLHKNFLFKLYSESRRPSPFWTQDETRRLRFDLEKYGGYLNLNLYPKNLPRMIDEFLSLHGEFFKRYMGIEELAKKQIESPVDLHGDLLRNYIGLDPYLPTSYTIEEKVKYGKIAQKITEENPQLVSEAKDFLEKTRSLDKQISDKLEDFLKSNNLRLEEEATYR
jgi:hypothetical protein